MLHAAHSEKKISPEELKRALETGELHLDGALSIIEEFAYLQAGQAPNETQKEQWRNLAAAVLALDVPGVDI